MYGTDVIGHFSLKSNVYLKVEWDYLQFLIVEKLNDVVSLFFPYKFIYLFIYPLLAAMGLRCCTWALPSHGERGSLLAAACGPPIAVASPAAEHGLQACGLQACRQLWHTGSAVVARGLSCSSSMWDPPGPGIEPVSPALAGGLPSTVPPGKSKVVSFFQFC